MWEKKDLGNQSGATKAKLPLPGGWKGANSNGKVDKQENPRFPALGAETSETKSWFSCSVASPK